MVPKFRAATKVQKVSDNIISQIRDAILSGQLKPKDRVASEKELISDFGASKATVREALRVLEVMGLVKIKKGLGGGIFVAEVNMQTTVNSIINFLHFNPVSIADITMIRYMFEPGVVQMVASLVQPKDIKVLESMITEERPRLSPDVTKEIGFHRYLARMTENPILILILDFVDNLLTDINLQANPELEFYASVERAHLKILECLSRKDAAGATAAIIEDILQAGAYLAKRTGSSVFDPNKLIASPNGFHHPFTVADGKPEEDVAGVKYLASLIGNENVAKLQNQGALSVRVGTGNLLLIDLTDKFR
jgi:GntR family transcriptional repressor for pyruvate dehydrogenase complex